MNLDIGIGRKSRFELLLLFTARFPRSLTVQHKISLSLFCCRVCKNLSNMAVSRAVKILPHVKEIRIHLCQKSEGSKGVR